MDIIKDGFYLSVYSCVNKYLCSTKKSLRHDHNMSLWKKVSNNLELIHHWELERITGFKHHEISFYDKESSIEFINMLLSEHNLCIDNIVYIFGTPELANSSNYYIKEPGSHHTYHALSHLFTSLMIDTDIFYSEDILALSLDGGSDCLIDNDDYANRYDYLGAYSTKGKIKYFPIHSPGPYWYNLKYITGLEEGTLMALATATKCRTLERVYDDDEVKDIYRIFKDSNAKLINKIYQHITSYTMNDLGVKFDCYDDRFTEEENKISMVAKLVQEISLKQVQKVIDKAIEEFGIDPTKVNLALSGGYALNCPTNTFLMRKYNFKKQLMAPCVNDGGQAIGMGMYYFYNNCEKINFKLSHPYYGDSDYDMSVLNKEPYKNHIQSIENSLEHFTDDILENPIVWFDGCAEIGPRALGHRSILANPTEVRSKDLLNLFKKRQWWRPVAPLILYDELDNWFEEVFESPYMLNNFVLRDEKKDIVPAIIHLDQTARVQTIRADLNSKLYLCMKQYFTSTGIPIICNTSLNDRGEPIINTIEEALNFSLRKGINVIYINGIRIMLKDHSKFLINVPTIRKHECFTKYENTVDLKMTPDEYMRYFMMPRLHTYNIENDQDIKKVQPILNKITKLFKFT
ncbi:carbamoyltransferase C-terminal domain-containing protein [Anaerocolumna jejuensis]|uniref:carbamoyltransferase C-terminal domain-containing protein n=1 Tax=Anaerocolumna jejuensis TaxID=259063 RepID=UPI003F7C0080